MEDLGTFPIELDGRPYQIEIGSWKARDVTDFSPKTTVPGTGAVFGDLQMYQPISANNWQHGLGFIWHQDEAGYLSTDGYIDTRHKGAVTLFTNRTSSDTNNNQKNGGLIFSNSFLTWGASGVRAYTSAAWGAVNVQRPIFDAASEGSATGIADLGTLTVSHTVTTEGSSRALFVGVMVDAAAINFVDVATMDDRITATYNGVAMTFITGTAVINTVGVIGFYLLNPATGANDIVVTFNTEGGTTEAVLIGQSFIYCLQTTGIFDTVTTATGSVATSTITPTASDRENVWDFLGKLGNEAGDAASVQLKGSISGNNQTQIAQDDQTAVTGIHACSSYFFVESADTTPSPQWNWTNSRAFAHFAVPINPIAEVEVRFLAENGEFVFAQPGTQRLMRSTSGTADYLPAGVNNASSDYSWIEIHGGYIFAGKESEAEVYFDTNSDLSALAGDPADDADELSAGPGTLGTSGGISFLEKLAVPRDDGLWTMDTDDATTTNWISKRTLNFKNLRSSINFRSIVTHGGSLYFTIQDKILYQWNGAKLQDITPAPITDAWEYVNYHRFDNFTPFGTWLLMTARTSETSYSEAILAWDGVGFHKLADAFTEETDAAVTMLAIDPVNNYIWHHISDPDGSISGVGINETFYTQYQIDSDFPHANFPTSGTHQLTTSRIHAGFRRVDKSMPALWIEVDNLVSSRAIEVQYAIDDSATFRSWDTLSTDGEHLLVLPQNRLTEEFKYIRLRFIFVTVFTTETPVLEGYAMMVMMRPDFKMGYTFDVIGGTNTASGMFEDDRTAYSIMHDLRRSRDMKSPISLITPFGDEIYGYLTSLTENAIEYEPEGYEGGDTNILQVIRVNFVESLEVAGTEQDVRPSW